MGSLRSLLGAREKVIRYPKAFHCLRGDLSLGSKDNFEEFDYSYLDWFEIANCLNTCPDLDTSNLLRGELNRMAVILRFHRHLKEEPVFRDPVELYNGKPTVSYDGEENSLPSGLLQSESRLSDRNGVCREEHLFLRVA
jgi:hypothetical protein